MINRDEVLSRVREISASMSQIEGQISSITAEIENRKNALEELRRNLAGVRSQIDNLRNNLQKIREELNRLGTKRQSILDSIRNNKSKILELNIEIQKLREKMEIYRKALNALNEYIGGKPIDKDRIRMLAERLEFYFETSPTDPAWAGQFIKMISE
ncbi:MAG: hypothetical protein JZD41_08545, partial [Thermoproteus sp.]|nr:hypothetical protein [Thermoproteus sp.]